MSKTLETLVEKQENLFKTFIKDDLESFKIIFHEIYENSYEKLQSHFNERNEPDTVLATAIAKNSTKIAMFLLGHIDDILNKSTSHSLLYYAVREGNVDIVKALIRKGVNINIAGHSNNISPKFLSIFEIAAVNGHHDILAHLIENYVPAREIVFDEMIISKIVKQDFSSTMELLINCGYINLCRKNIIFHLSIVSENMKIFRTLLDTDNLTTVEYIELFSTIMPTTTLKLLLRHYKQLQFSNILMKGHKYLAELITNIINYTDRKTYQTYIEYTNEILLYDSFQQMSVVVNWHINFFNASRLGYTESMPLMKTVIELIKQYVYMYCGKEYLQYLFQYLDFYSNITYEDLQKELERMKNIPIRDDNYTTFYDIMVSESVHDLLKICNKKQINLPNPESFPILRNILKGRIEYGAQQRALINVGIRHLNAIYSGNDDISEIIINHLNNVEIRKLIQACSRSFWYDEINNEKNALLKNHGI